MTGGEEEGRGEGGQREGGDKWVVQRDRGRSRYDKMFLEG